MKPRYVLAPEAARDLVGIWRYIKKQSSLEMAERVEGVIRDRIVFLAENPNAGHWRKDLTRNREIFPGVLLPHRLSSCHHAIASRRGATWAA